MMATITLGVLAAQLGRIINGVEAEHRELFLVKSVLLLSEALDDGPMIERLLAEAAHDL